MSRAVTLVNKTFNDGSVKFFYLLVTKGGSAPSTKDVKKLETDLGFVEHTKVLNDGRADGVKALWGPSAKVKNTMVLAPGFKVSSIDFADNQMEAAIKQAKTE